VYGLRVTGPRILVAAILVVAYSLLEDAGGFEPLEVTDLLFTEWPLMFAIITIVAIMADRVISSSRRMAALERQTHEQLVTARDDERRRLATDLHDGLGQTLTALVLSLDAAEGSLEAGPAPRSQRSRDALRRAQEIAELALEETRTVAHQLRPARMREMGLTNAIRDLAAHAGREVEVTFDPRLSAADLLPVETEMQAYRIVQEALANALRHSSAASIQVDLQLRGGRLQIDVRDDGDGFEVSRSLGDGIGLHGMHERAKSIGATLDVQSRVGTGTRVRLLVPLGRQATFG
jgi:two-component system, NarL family, sensor histidine kinase UhpB